ncbi:MAG: flexitail domain-containing putative surface protein [Dehalococcoidia bacterium]
MSVKRTLTAAKTLILLTTLAVASSVLAPERAFATVPELSDVTHVAAGGAHTCAVKIDASLQCWGYNGHGQLGDGTLANHPTPEDVLGLGSGVTTVAAGGTHTCAITMAAGLKCWGENYGRLGNGTTTMNSSIPVDVVGLGSGVAAIALGGYHTCALTTTGAAKCWGSNEYGQVGDGTSGIGNNVRSTPMDVVGLDSDIAALTAGFLHTCALTADGGVKCWGRNDSGQLGDGSMTDSNVPVDVLGLASGVVAISAGGYYTCALTTAGGVTCWGNNQYGQLGNGTMTSSALPVDVAGLQGDVTAVSGAYYFHACALTTDGDVMCWGRNHFGQLGNDTYADSSTPVSVVGLGSDDVVSLVGGGHQNCVLLTSSSVRCWGSNTAGELGDGSTTSRSSPVTVLTPVPGSDLDGDNCTDFRELASYAFLGGARNPKNFWDFFDTPDLNAMPQRDKAISISDITRVVGRFGTTGNAGIDPLSKPPATGYHTAFDRTTIGPNAWNAGPPNGSITIEDILNVVHQFGHSCA